MADLVLAVDIGGTKLAAGLSLSTGPWWNGSCCRPGPGADGVGEGDRGGRGRGALGGPGRTGGPGAGAAGPGDRLLVCGAGCGGPMTPGRGGGVATEHLGLALLSLAPASRRADRAADLRRQRRQGARTRRGVARRRRRCHADYIGMVVSTGVGGGIVLNGRLLDGRLGDAGTSATSSWCRTVAPAAAAGGGVGGGGVGDHARRHHGRAGAACARGDIVERTGTLVVGRHRVGRQPLGPPARRREQVGGARLRRPLLRGGPGGDGHALWARVRPGCPRRAGWPGRRGPARRGGPRGAATASERRRERATLAPGTAPPSSSASSRPDPNCGGHHSARCAAWPGRAGGTARRSSRYPGRRTGTSVS